MTPVLADSNILLRVTQPAHAHHAVALNPMGKLLRQTFDICVVTQNLIEFWAVATRPVGNRGLCMSPATAADEMRKLRSIFYLLDGTAGVADAWENRADFKRYPGITVINPAYV